MCYTISLVIMALVVMAGLYFNPFIGLVLVLSAGLAVACTWGKRGQ